MKISVKKRKGNLPPNPLPLLVMLILCIIIAIHACLYPASMPLDIVSFQSFKPNVLDLVFWGLISLGFIVITINITYSLYESLRYGGT
jgi:hypothetical protein